MFCYFCTYKTVNCFCVHQGYHGFIYISLTLKEPGSYQLLIIINQLLDPIHFYLLYSIMESDLLNSGRDKCGNVVNAGLIHLAGG